MHASRSRVVLSGAAGVSSDETRHCAHDLKSRIASCTWDDRQGAVAARRGVVAVGIASLVSEPPNKPSGFQRRVGRAMKRLVRVAVAYASTRVSVLCGFDRYGTRRVDMWSATMADAVGRGRGHKPAFNCDQRFIGHSVIELQPQTKGGRRFASRSENTTWRVRTDRAQGCASDARAFETFVRDVCWKRVGPMQESVIPRS